MDMHIASDEDWQHSDGLADEQFQADKEKAAVLREEERAKRLTKLTKIHEAKRAKGFDTKEQAEVDAERRKIEREGLLEELERERMEEEEVDTRLRAKAANDRTEKVQRARLRFFQYKKLTSALNRVQIGILRSSNSLEIMGIVRRDRRNVCVVVGGLTAAIQLTYNNLEECEKAGGRLFAAPGVKIESGCECTVKSIQTYMAEAIIVEKALGLLANLCILPANKERFAAVGAIDVVLESLRQHSNDPLLATEACRAIALLCENCPANVEAAEAAGAVAPVMEILGKYGERADTGTAACQAILALIAENDSLLTEALELGIKDWIYETLEKQADHKHIFSRYNSAVAVRNAIRLLTLLESSGILLEVEDLAILLRCLGAHRADAPAQLFALQLLHAALAPEHPAREAQAAIFAEYSKRAARAGFQGGGGGGGPGAPPPPPPPPGLAAALCAAMKAHPRVGNLQWQACRALQLLLAADARTASDFRKNQGPQCIGEGLKQNTHLPPVLEQYCRVILLTGTSAVDRNTYCSPALDCPARLSKLLYVHRQHRGVQFLGRAALAALGRGAGAGAGGGK